MFNKLISIILDNRDRFITGFAILGVTLLIALFNNLYLIWGFFGVIYLIALNEMVKLVDINDKILIYSIGSLIWIALLFIEDIFDFIFLAMLFLASVLAYDRKFEYSIFMPLIYPTVPMIYLFKLYELFGITSLIWLLIVVASTDIGAYFVGKSIGERKFSKTSPNKTLEGVIGGVTIATLFGSIYGYIILEFNLILVVLLSLLMAKFSIFGDLFESFLKREADVKDSGVIFPGHGGVLDRVDGYLFAGVIMYIFLKGLM